MQRRMSPISNLPIRIKFAGLEFVVFLALAVLALTALYTNKTVQRDVLSAEKKMQTNSSLIEELQLVHRMQLSQSRLLESAKEGLLDRDESLLRPELVTVIEQETALFSSNMARLLFLVDQTSGERGADYENDFAAIQKMLPEFIQRVNNELPGTVKQRHTRLTALSDETMRLDGLLSRYEDDMFALLTSLETSFERRELISRSLNQAYSAAPYPDENLIIRLSLALSRLTLNATVALGYREQGYIDEQRRTAMTENLSYLQKNLSRLKEYIALPEEQEMFDALQRMLTEMAPLIQNDIIRFVEASIIEQSQIDIELFHLDQCVTEEANTLSLHLSNLAQTIREETNLTGAALAEAQQSLENRVAHSFRVSLSAALAAFLTLLLLFRRVSTHLVKPLKQAVVMANAIEHGNLSQRLNVMYHDEIGHLGLALNSMAAQLESSTLELQDKHRELQQQITQRTSEVEILHRLLAQVSATSQQLGTASDDLANISNEMASGAKQTSQQVQTVSSNSQQSNERFHAVSASTDEVASSIREISANIGNIMEIVKTTVNNAEGAAQAIDDLRIHSQEIDTISNVITAITQQTNLLALNASIEAARAGEGGRGFNVVAQEVKQLAQETAISAKDITQKIEAIQTRGERVSAAISNVMAMTSQVSLLVEQTSNAIVEQSHVTDDIVRMMEEAATGSEHVTQAIHDISATAQHSSLIAATVQKEAQRLKELSAQLQEVVIMEGQA